MGLFSNDNKSSSNFLGVDIGGSSIKLVELADNNGRAQLVTYGFLERSLKSGGKLIDNPEETAKMIRKIIDSAKVTTKKTITALPARAVFSSIISLPEINRKDLSSTKKITAAVEWEAKKVLPLPLEEMILDWKVLSSEDILKDPDNKQEKIKNLQVLLTAASKEVVNKYIAVFKKADLDLISLETESFALARALVGKDKSTVVLVDIGAGDTDISVIENSIPLMTRSVGIGGFEITKSIQTNLDVSVEQAEQFKRDLEMNSQNFDEDFPEIIKRPFEAIMNEIQYTINFYLEQPHNKNKRIEKIILSGGTSNLYNITDYIAKKLDIKTFVGNPWARVIYPADLQPALDEIGPRLASSIGLAMRDIE